MREILKSSLLSLVVGVFFGAGVLAAYGIYKEVQAIRAPARVERPQGFEFPQHERIPAQPRFTVVGTLRNASDKAWASVRIVAGIYAGEAYMTYCWTDLDRVRPHSSRPFRLVCKNTEGTHVPANVSYRLSVATATLGRAD
jgi:hypothetical protein